MPNQFKLLEGIDRDKTKKAVKAALEKYRFYLLTIPEDKLPKITASYSLVPPANTNTFHSSTEEAAVRNIDCELERDRYINWLIRGVNRLNEMERKIIYKRYLNEDEMYDYEIYNELGMSERKYYRIKARVYYKLAFLLRIEVYTKSMR
ncbi:ArpU family phage packaging/lysis transcriptional regulator [Schinkia azotoformans]|uniref:ArpU family phage packaging/lysis transcriptional regulator n=1 Tax=Schinkia azotoformans TaxID=1454 RepID=UPI002DBCD270|nr:ArpU family phage packaging/lysis transcriptional regulator [Schinkia azotoformans]MEC1723924.1 ArpU family phage packaging/lysis transcriptional regulator [Schinkia azotoformans]